MLQDDKPADPSATGQTWPLWFTTSLCVSFLIVSFVIWLAAASTPARIIYYLFFFFPNYICGEYLAEKFLAKVEFLSTERVGFSPLRILIGVCFVLAFFAFIYVMMHAIRLILFG